MEYRPQVDKLVGQADWSGWKRQVTLLLQHQNVFGVVNGAIRRSGDQDRAAEKRSIYQKLSLAQLVFSAINEKNLELTTTCESAQEVWDKQLSMYEISSGQKLERLLEMFFQESKAEVARSLSTFWAECDSAGHLVWKFLSDGGREFDNSEVRTLLEYTGANVRIVMPYTPEQDWTAVKHIFCYLRGTLSQGIYFDGSSKGDELLVYSDADFAGDSKSRSSRSGVVSRYALNKTGKQSPVSKKNKAH